MAAKRKNSEAALAAAEKKRIANEMAGLARERDWWRAAGMILAWLWTKLKF
jgi:hypothetical protein